MCFLCFIIYGLYWFNYDISRFGVPKGSPIIQKTSPNGQYNLKVYYANGSSTAPTLLIGILVAIKNESKNSYIYLDKAEKATINWIDNNDVLINGHKIEIPNGKFDFRHP